MQIRRSCSATWRTFSQAVGRPSRRTSTEPNTFSTTPGWRIQSRGLSRAYRLLPPKVRRSYTKACTRYLARVTSSSSSPRLRLVAYPLAFMTSSALKTVGSPSTGIRSKRFHLAINGKIATASFSTVRGRTYASRHVWKKIGGAFFSAGVFLTCVWSKGNSQVALTRMRMPNGFPGPTPHIPPEKAFSISVHLRRPDSIKGWGTWLDGRFHRVTEWNAGGIQIFDMESEPVALRTSGFDSVHVYIPRSVINRFSDENEQKRIRNLHCTPGTKDEVTLHWARMMLPFSDPLQLPRLVIDEMIMMFCAHLSRTYQGRSQPPEVVTGGLTIWQ